MPVDRLVAALDRLSGKHVLEDEVPFEVKEKLFVALHTGARSMLCCSSVISWM